MNKYELYEKNKNLKGFDLTGHCFFVNGDLYVYALIGNGELVEEKENIRTYAGDFRLIDVCDGNRWDDRNLKDKTVEDIINMMEEHYESRHGSVVYIGKPKFDMHMEGFDFVFLDVDHIARED